jgi:peptidoglycan/xylan/chitin deacetylase (PgdA/CDA1 family)
MSLTEVANAIKALCLTYDDGPGERLTPAIADMLRKHAAHATFFLLGRRAAVRPDLVDSLAADGHELACHTHDHLNAWKSWPWSVAADIDRGYATLARWVRPDGFFRPPYGKSTPLTRWQVRRRGGTLVRWTHDSMDTTRGQLPRAGDVIDRVLGDGGGVVLLHDFDREGDEHYARQRAEYVLEVTDGLLIGAKRRSIAVVTLGTLKASRGTLPC